MHIYTTRISEQHYRVYFQFCTDRKMLDISKENNYADAILKQMNALKNLNLI